MPQGDVNQTYKADQFRIQNVEPTDFKVVEFRGSDPTDLSKNPKRIWARTDTGELKYSVNGIDVNGVADSADLAGKADQSDLDATNAVVASKANQSALNTTNAQVTANTNAIVSNTSAINANTTAINNIGNASPKGTFATLTALQAAFPTGTTGIYVVTADGKWYYWNGTAWTAGGVYQSTSIPDGAVTPAQTSFLTIGKNLFNKDVGLTVGSFMNTNGSPTVDPTYDYSDYIEVSSGVTYAVTACRFVTVYGTNKVSIPAQGINNSSGPIPSTVTPLQDGFIIVTFRHVDINTSQVEVGTTQTAYEPWGIKPSVPLYLNDQSIKKKYLELSVQTTLDNADKLVPYMPLGKNMLDTSKSTIGMFITSNTGALASNPLYDTSDFVAVKSGVAVVVSPKIRKLLAYTTGKVSIPASYLDAMTNNYVFTPTQDGFIRVSYFAEDSSKMQIETGSAPTQYESFSIHPTVPLILPTGRAITSALQGKRVLNLGDSIAYGANNNGISYADLIAGKYNMIVYDQSVGGATLADTTATEPTRSCIQTQLSTFITNNPSIIPEYILLEGYTNDILYSPLGTKTSGYNDSWVLTTMAGGLEWICRKLKDTYPSAKVLFVTTHNMSSRDFNTQKVYHDTAVDILKKWSVPIVDLYNEGGLNTWNDTMKTTYTDTGTHPNGTAYNLFYVPPIEAKMNAL